MTKIKRFTTKAVSTLSNRALHRAAAFMVVLGGAAVTLSAVPFWHNEPEMPRSMLNEIQGGS